MAVTPVSKGRFWGGVVISAIPVFMLLFSAFMKVVQKEPEFSQGLEHIGWPVKIAITLAIVEVSCTLIYLFPRTAVLGAILLTGYLGGATATHVRVGDPTWYIPVVLGIMVWLGLWLRDERLNDLIPLRK